MIFLRPYWLILLIVPFLFLWIQRKGSTQNPWRHYIAPALMPYLSVSSKVGGGQSRVQWVLSLIWCLLIIGLSGPAVDKWPTPAVDEAPATVIVVDLNTMNPEKTAALHIKLFDIVKQLNDNQIGLVLYDTKGYIALPLTRDNTIVNEIIPSLQPSVMPDVGNRVEKGVEKAVELLKNTNQKSGRILFITGGTPDIQQARALVENTPYTVGVLGIGNEKTGEPVTTRSGSYLRDSNGQFVLAKPDKTVLSQLGTYRTSTPAGKEIADLINATRPTETPFINSNMPDFATALITADVWRDFGFYFVLAALPFIAFLFRKGVFFIIIIGCFGLMSEKAYAGLWLRPDQESYRTVSSGNEAYRNQDYQKALSLYESDKTPQSLYNKANTLAQLGQYQQAIDTYAELLSQYSDHEDGAYNKEYLEKQLQPPQQQNNSDNNNQQSDSQDNNQNSDSSDSQSEQQSNNQNQSDSSDSQSSDTEDSESNGNQENKSDSSDSQQQPQQTQNQSSENTPPEENESDNQQSNNETTSDVSDSSDNQNQSDSSDSTTEQSSPIDEQQESQSDKNDSSTGIENNTMSSDMIDQETQQIINRLKTDPYRLLRYRLYRQYRSS